MELRRPELLLTAGLPLLLLSLWAARGSLVALGRRRLWGSVLLRALCLLAIALALADLQAVLPHDERAVVFAVDASDSVPPTAREHLLRWTERAWETHRPGDHAGLVLFGGRARAARLLAPDYALRAVGFEDLEPERSELAAALRLGGQLLLSAEGERELVLLSDGNDDAPADALREAAALATAGVRVTTVAAELSPSPGEVLVRAVDAPPQAAVGEAFLLRVELWARGSGEAVVHVVRDGRYAESLSAELAPGVNVLTLPQRLEAAGTHAYQVRVEAPGDGELKNNLGGALVRVRGRRKVLYACGPIVDRQGEVLRSFEVVGAPLREVLGAAGFDVDLRGPDALPLDAGELAGYDVLVFGGVSADRWSPSQMEAVRAYVFSQGGGLLALGSERSFGQGGYYRTPIEEALPVHSDVRGKKVLPSLALVLCIDRSGSMAARTGVATRLDLAKLGAERIAELLQPFDLLGVIGFDEDAEWAQPLAPVDDGERTWDALRGLESGGGTAFAPALAEALKALEACEARIKHAVLLTDGHSGESPARLANLLAGFARAEVSLSTVGVGSGVNQSVLRSLASGAEGRYLQADDAESLPRLLTQEAVVASRALLVEREVRVRHLGGLEDLGIDWKAAPPLQGFVLTVPKDGAEVLLDSGPGDGPEDGPLLVRWRYGLGKAAAFTSDAGGRWCADWLRWPGYAPFVAGLVGWLARDPDVRGVDARLRLDGGRGLLEVEFAEGSRPPSGRELRARLTGPEGAGLPASVSLLPRGPRRYEARFPARRPGAYYATLEASAAEGAATEALATAGAVLSYPREYRHVEQDAAHLERIAERTGGRALSVDDPPELVFSGPRAVQRSYRPLAPWLLVFAALLLLGEVAVRRLFLPSLRLRRARSHDPAAVATSAPASPVGAGVALLRSRKAERRAAASALRGPAPSSSSGSARAGGGAERRAPAAEQTAPAQPSASARAPEAAEAVEEASLPGPTGSMAKLLEAKRKARRHGRDRSS
ncbi:MAG: VWA domain-containing protein [Planctomycetota bacterium]|nr:MAG: VWA domain-containing protein [Planctomycetota bacterium]